MGSFQEQSRTLKYPGGRNHRGEKRAANERNRSLRLRKKPRGSARRGPPVRGENPHLRRCVTGYSVHRPRKSANWSGTRDLLDADLPVGWSPLIARQALGPREQISAPKAIATGPLAKARGCSGQMDLAPASPRGVDHAPAAESSREVNSLPRGVARSPKRS